MQQRRPFFHKCFCDITLYFISGTCKCAFTLVQFYLQVFSIPLGGMCVRQPFAIGGEDATKFRWKKHFLNNIF